MRLRVSTACVLPKNRAQKEAQAAWNSRMVRHNQQRGQLLGRNRRSKGFNAPEAGPETFLPGWGHI